METKLCFYMFILLFVFRTLIRYKIHGARVRDHDHLLVLGGTQICTTAGLYHLNRKELVTRKVTR